MGQKVHPESMRVGYIHDWKSHWFTERHFADYLAEDNDIRTHIENRLSHAGLSQITIRKDANEVEVNIHTARPGIVIGKSGSEVDALRRDLHRITNKSVKVNILEIKRPELDAALVAQSVAEQLQNRVAFRRAMKRALTSAMRSGAKGCKIQVGGRLGGAEMSRTESYSDGRVPLHTLRADIDYGFAEARTTFGRIGVKCWINKGEIMPEGFTGVDLTDLDAPAPRATPQAAAATVIAAAVAAATVVAAAVAVAAVRVAAAVAAVRAAAPAASAAAAAAVAAAASAAAVAAVGGAWPAGWWSLMLAPKRVKHRKVMRGRSRGYSRAQTTVQFGEYGLKALDHGHLTNRQIEAARIAMTRKIKRGGKVWINLFPDKPFTKKPAETRMGSGKGNARGLGRRRQARPRDVRARRRAGGPGARGDAPRRPQAAGAHEVRHAGGRGLMPSAKDLRDLPERRARGGGRDRPQGDLRAALPARHRLAGEHRRDARRQARARPGTDRRA